jgi:hypothetical protein
MTNKIRIVLALFAGLLIGGSRYLYESSMPSLVPYDAQGGIWVAFSLVVSGATVLVTSLLCFLALRFFGEHMRVWGSLALLGLILIGGCTANTMLQLKEIRLALADAANPTMNPDRLRALVGYQSGFGYEIDNRIAENSNTPVDVLRSLHGKPEQVGTEMCLARNPNTPDDILLELAKRDDKWAEWIQKSLAMNPRYTQMMGPTTGSSVRLPRGGATATDP